jgi:glucose/arabinose dehydrogenase
VRIRPIVIFVLIGGLGPVREGAAQSCPAIRLGPVVASGLSGSLFVTHAGDGSNRLFIVEQAGAIKVLQPGGSQATVFLTIPSGKIIAGGEQGLLGLAFHPDFESNRRFFVYYTSRPNGDTVIAEYRASESDPDVADPTEKLILGFAQPFSNHNGGMMAFDENGHLFIASGDGGSSNDPGNRAQNINQLLGKILRIDIDTPNGQVPYSSPPDNPYFGPTPGADEIYAIGVRNPWRLSFDRLTGQLLVGDVGQGQREEVDIVELGGNYGWRVMEGTRCNIAGDALPCNSPLFTPPAFEYTHAAGRCSITGGYVYRGPSGALPEGTYVHGDFCTGEIFGVDVDDLPFDPGSLPAAPPLLLDTPLLLASFGEDEAGEMYAVGLGGQVQRLLAAVSIAPTNQAFGEGGGTGQIAVTSPSGCPAWTAVSRDPWITITAGERGTGNGTVFFTVAANPDALPRSGTIDVAGLAFTVDQEPASTIQLAIDDVQVSEGDGMATFAVRLSGESTEPISVQYDTASDTATWFDYFPQLVQRLVFEPGETEKPVAIRVWDDGETEHDETFRVRLSAAENAAIADAEGVGTILDDDPPPALSIAGTTFVEGAGFGLAVFVVTLDAASALPVTVDFTTVGGTAAEGTEYGPRHGTLIFLPGWTTRRVFVLTLGDVVDEPDENFFVRMQGAVNATITVGQATAVIQDDDPPAPIVAPSRR